MTQTYPYIEVENRDGLIPGYLVKRKATAGRSFFAHPFDGNGGWDLQPKAGPFLYIKTVEYEHGPEDDYPKDYQFDVVLWEDRLIEMSVGRLQRLIRKI